MNAADAMFLLMLALADICLIVHLRRRRSRRRRLERMMRSLKLYLRRELCPTTVVTRPTRGLLRAS